MTSKEASDYITSVSDTTNLTTYKYGDVWAVANNPNVYVNCKKIVLAQKSLDVEIDITDEINKFETITINGVKFRNV